MGKRPTNCTWCGNDLDSEERRSPRRDSGAVICDICFGREYEGNCTRCQDVFEKTELDTRPGKLIGVWREAPALGGTVQPGYYRVLRWPIYTDGMIEAYFFPDALVRVSDLDRLGQLAADREQAMAGPMCKGCQREVRKLPGIADEVEIAAARWPDR